jgi:crossover junction endodeoxyribonuclease RusA
LNAPPFIPDMAAEQPHKLRIVLPWPDKRLSPNARIHWRAKAAIKAKARADAHFLALEAAGYSLGSIRTDLAGDAPIPLCVTFYPPDKRHRDDDNMVASAKHARDGIADALKVNDRRFRPHYVFAEPEKPGRVEIVIPDTEAEAAE